MGTSTDTGGDLGFRRLAAGLGLTTWQLRLALEHGMFPGPDAGGRWPAGTAERHRSRTRGIVEAFGEAPPVGAARAAARLALRLALDVERADVEVLVADGDLHERVRAECRDRARARARRSEKRHEDALRTWMLHRLPRPGRR